MVLLIANKGTTGSTTVSTTIEIDLSISVVSTLTVKANGGSCSSSSSGVSSKSSESTCGDSCSNDGSSLDGTSLISSSSSSSSGSSSTTSTPVKKSERLLAKSVAKGSGGHSKCTSSDVKSLTASLPDEGICMWRECSCFLESSTNILDHIQTIHVAPQTKAKGYICLWEGCKSYNKKASSLSWIERHVVTHGGIKPYRCFLSGCGISFVSEVALQRHINSHITANGNPIGTSGHSVARKLDSSPSKTARRKKLRSRKLKLNTGQFVDFFDKRTIEVIKYRLSRAVQIEESSSHNCTFTCQVLSRRTCSHEEPHLLVRWYPLYILPDEWIPQSKFIQKKIVPFRQLPPEKLKLLFPNMFPPERKEKARRKWKPKMPDMENECTKLVKMEKEEDVKRESICESCNSKKLPSAGCQCIPLDSDWADFLTDQYWS